MIPIVNQGLLESFGSHGDRQQGLPSLLIPPSHTGRQTPTVSFRGPSAHPRTPLVSRRARQTRALHPAQPATTTQASQSQPGGTGGRRRAQRQAARQLVGSGPRGQGVAARACAEGLSAPVTERRGVGERDLARPAWPPPLGLPLRPRGASRAARPLGGGRARPGVAVSTREAGGGRRGGGAGRSGRGQGEGPAQPRPRWVK